MAVLLAALSALSYGSADFLGGVGSRRSPVYAVLFWSQLMGLAVAAVAAPLVGAGRVAAADLLWGAAAGIAGAAGISILYHGLAHTIAAVVSPTAAVVGAVLPVAFGVALGERPEPVTWIGVALAIPAIVLLSHEPGEPDGRVGRALRSGVLSGIGFGVFFVCISRTSDDSGIYPLIAARIASIAVVVLITAVMRRSLAADRKSRPSIAAAGALDMLSNLFFLAASRAGLLVIATVVTSLYPAPTVILSRFVYRERLDGGRIAGLVLAVAGVALIGIG